MLLWIVFLLSLFYTLYVIVLYPILIHLLARIRPKPVKRGPYFPSVSIILATHNGAAFLREKLESIFALNYPSDKIEVVLVDDDSVDSTPEIAAEFAGRIHFLRIPKSGKAGAVNHGIATASGEVLVLTDVRQKLDPESLRFLTENLADPSVGVVSAELQIREGSSHEEANTGAYWKYEKWIRLNLSALDSIFGATGSYYAVRRELAIAIPKNTLCDDMHLPLHAFFCGYRLIVDRRAKMFDYPTGLASEFGRKVRTLAGNYQIIRNYPRLLSPANRMLPHYLSYKLGRLLLPFALIACSVSSLLTGGKFAWFSAIVQATVYALAFLDPKISAGSPIKRLSSPIRSFLVMMLATLCAVSIWFVPAENLWKPTRVSRKAAEAQGLPQP
jgi:poly-beta-1,6-N-acetyl-D-glucosamine synthase